MTSLEDVPSTSRLDFPQGTSSSSTSSSQDCVPTHILVELTSLEELTFPTSSSKRLKYTCVASSSRNLILGTSTGTVYVFSRYAARNRSRTSSSIPVQVFTTKDGPVNMLAVSPGEEMLAIGGDTGRVTVAQLHTAMPPTLVYTVPGDARKPDKVTSLAWSSNLKQVFSGHSSGLVHVHRLGNRSVFRAANEKLTSFEGEVVQLDVSGQQLLVATTFAAYLYHLDSGGTFQQVGKKPRTGSSHLGACFVRQIGADETPNCEYVVAARPNGRLWEANLVGVVYRTHQFRQNKCVPRAPPISFRGSFPLSNSEFEGIHPENQDVLFNVLRKIVIESHTYIVSAFGSRILIVDPETSRIVIVSELDSEILDVCTSANDIFILFSGSIGLRKFSLFDRSKAVEKMHFKSLFVQCAQFMMFCSPGTSFQQEAIKETERLQAGLSKLLAENDEKNMKRSEYDNLDKNVSEPSPPPPTSQKLSSGVHKVLNTVHESGYEDDFTFNAPNLLRERSRSSPGACSDDQRNLVSPDSPMIKRASIPLTIVEARESTKNGTPDVVEEDILHRARQILESDGKLVEKESLKFLLQLEDVNRDEIRFTPTVTIGNAAKALAELAMTGPIDVSTIFEDATRGGEKLAEKPNSNRPEIGKRARIVKVVQPGVRPRAPLNAAKDKDNQNIVLPSVRDGSNNVLHNTREIIGHDGFLEEDDETRRLRDEMWLDLRLSQISRERNDEEETGTLKQSDTGCTLATETSSPSRDTTIAEELSIDEEVTPTLDYPIVSKAHCRSCGMHRSWTALALLSTFCTRAVIIKDDFGDGGVPSTVDDWTKILKHVAYRENPVDLREICPRCEMTVGGISRIAGTRKSAFVPEGTRPNIDKIHERCTNISEDRLDLIICPHPRESSRPASAGEKRIEKNSTERSTTNGNRSNDAISVEIESNFGQSTAWKWICAVELHVILALASVVLGSKEVLGIVRKNEAAVGKRMKSIDWAFLVAMCCREQTLRRNPITAKAMMNVLKEEGAADWVVASSEEPKTPRAPMLRNPHISAMQSWIVDANGKCPICTLPIKTVVGGKDSGVAAFMCGHVYHDICMAGRTGCIACRVRARRASRAAVGQPTPAGSHAVVPSF
ncbi:unnamed protein product [Caenorhabditis auriculariae]|uniref:RING-type domain-containing protein n=1 Tax=Caenorhabditis auriculariae TaxID=2777116 RepID=A0A8S1GSL9_9PELO|nr:unnamed protein product [Caenorhabditis auriculariae]